MTGIGIKVPCLVIAAAVGCLSTLAAADGDGRFRDGIAADVNGEAITRGELEEAVRKQVEQMEQRLEQFRRSMLDRLIGNLLLEQAARAEGLDLNDYLKAKVESVTVTRDEVDEACAKSRHRFPGMPEPEVRYRIRRGLEDSRRSEALQRLLTDLRRSARVRNFLLESSASTLDLQPQAGPSLGPQDASITIVEFSDFECSWCRRLQPVLRRVLKRWPQEVRLVYKHLPLDRHRNAFGASKAAVCADWQGRFWKFHDALYGEGQDLSPRGVVTIAERLGMEMKAFEECLEDEEASTAVRSNVVLARRAGVTGTPTLFVNNRRASNSLHLESEVEALLAVPSRRNVAERDSKKRRRK